jgi:undecaprenyl-diphosphatase
MFNALSVLDTKVFLFFNSLHTPLLDKLMLALSYNKTLLLFVVFGCCIVGIKYYKKSFGVLFFFLLVSFGLSDSISTRVFKNNIKRLRPCHEQVLAPQVHLAGKNCYGGKYGFVSSHAANSFSFAMFFWLILRKRLGVTAVLFIYAGLVSYSRVYLARHYPLDIICGGALGVGLSYFVYRMMQFIPGVRLILAKYN